MSPILGVIASSTRQGLSTTSFESIATINGPGSGGIITFSSIPQTYKHLQIRGIARSTRAVTEGAGARLRFNGDTGNNYSTQQIYGAGSGAGIANGGGSSAEIDGLYVSGSNASNGVYGYFIIDIYDYSLTTKYKTARLWSGVDRDGAGLVIERSGAYYANTNAITQVTLGETTGVSWTTDSQFALYGIKG
jgi:hypothetical protein